MAVAQSMQYERNEGHPGKSCEKLGKVRRVLGSNKTYVVNFVVLD